MVSSFITLVSSPIGLLLAQAGNSGPGFPVVSTLIVLVGIAAALFSVCRSANRG